MRTLQERILMEGKNLGHGILKVDSFINHQVDPRLMDACGQELARRFRDIDAIHFDSVEMQWRMDRDSIRLVRVAWTCSVCYEVLPT